MFFPLPCWFRQLACTKSPAWLAVIISVATEVHGGSRRLTGVPAYLRQTVLADCAAASRTNAACCCFEHPRLLKPRQCNNRLGCFRRMYVLYNTTP